MYTFSSAHKAAYKAGNPQGVTLEVYNGSTTIWVSEDYIREGTFAIDRCSSIGGSLPFGSAYSDTLTFELRDTSGEFAAYNWTGATIGVDLYVYISGTRTYTGRVGFFYVKQAKKRKNVVSVQALGALSKMDVPLTRAGDDGYNLYLSTIIENISAQCFGAGNVIDYSAVSTIASSTYMQNFTYPAGKDVTCRNALAWAAALCGASAIEHTESGYDDRIKLVRSSVSGETIDATNRFQGDCGEDISISGVQAYDAAQKEYSASGYSDEPYEIIIKSNGIFEQAVNQSDGTSYKQGLVTDLFNDLDGFALTPFTADVMPMPWLECGDRVTVVDSLGTSHTTIITHVRYVINGKMTIECNVADATERDEMLALPAFISRSTIAREMLVADALKSSNFVDDANSVYSQSGTYFDLAQGFIKSKEFAIDKDGNAYFSGQMVAGSLGGVDPNYFEVDEPVAGKIRVKWHSSFAEFECYDSTISLRGATASLQIGTTPGAIMDGAWGLPLVTTAPTAAYQGGGYRLVYLQGNPTNKYAGYIYLIAGNGIYVGSTKIASI